MPPKIKPWEKFKIGSKSERSNWINTSCQELGTIYHVAHLETADRILKDKQCRAGLIYDKSILNKERILVNWLSPNTWSQGSRYGNVGFGMDFKDLAEGMRYYWVESISYGIAACRILITDQDHDDNLEPYDPTKRDGPWYFDKEEDVHYWNGNYTLEFMFEGDIAISSFSSLHFFDHHDSFCNVDHETCKDKGISSPEAGERFIAGILADDLPIVAKHFREKKRGKLIPNHLLIHCIERIKNRTIKILFENGFIEHDSPLAPVMLKAALDQLHAGNRDDCKMLIGLFYDVEHFEKTLVNAVVQKFKLDSGDKLIDRE